jgi:hypothetical protein
MARPTRPKVEDKNMHMAIKSGQGKIERGPGEPGQQNGAFPDVFDTTDICLLLPPVGDAEWNDLPGEPHRRSPTRSRRRQRSKPRPQGRGPHDGSVMLTGILAGLIVAVLTSGNAVAGQFEAGQAAPPAPGQPGEPVSAQHFTDNPYAPALCNLTAINMLPVVQALPALSVVGHIVWPPECHGPPEDLFAENKDDYFRQIRAITDDSAADINRLGFIDLPDLLAMAATPACPLVLQNSGQVRLLQTGYKLVLRGAVGAIVQNHIVFIMPVDQATVLSQQPLYGDWLGDQALLRDNTGKCQVLLKSKLKTDDSAPPVPVAAQPSVVSNFGSDVVVLTPPDGYVIGHADSGLIEMVPEGETVQSWTHIFTMLIVQHRPGSIADMRKRSKSGFFKTCAKRNVSLSVEDPIRSENGFKIAEWVQSCDLTKSGPSKGQPETDIFKVVQGKEVDLFVSEGLRFVPSATEVERWKDFLGQTLIRPK